MSGKPEPQILSTKRDYAFLFLNFLIVALCNSSDNFLFEIFSFLTVRLEVFLSRNL